MRRGEALGLRWGDVDLTGGRVSIRRSAVLMRRHGEGKTIEIGLPESGRTRVVDIDSRRITVLKGAPIHDHLRMAHEDAPVLPTYTGAVRHPERSRGCSGPRGACAEGVGRRRAARDPATHACDRAAVGRGAPEGGARAPRHATISIILDTYSPVSPTIQRAAGDRFAAAVFGS